MTIISIKQYYHAFSKFVLRCKKFTELTPVFRWQQQNNLGSLWHHVMTPHFPWLGDVIYDCSHSIFKKIEGQNMQVIVWFYLTQRFRFNSKCDKTNILDVTKIKKKVFDAKWVNSEDEPKKNKTGQNHFLGMCSDV
jgi:hypothetical protein